MTLDLDEHLAAIAAGDASAFAGWLAGAERPIRESLRGFATAVDTEAVLQEALLRVWQVAPRVVADGRPNALLRMGVRVARNLALDEVRRARVQPTEMDALDRMLAAGGDPTPAPPDPLLRRLIEWCRSQLPSQPSRALEARLESAGADPDEILAERVGMRRNTFLQNFTRARRLLSACLEKAGVDPESLGGGAR